MVDARTVEFVEIPTGPALLSVLPRLSAALAGDGPALAPVAAGDAAGLARLTAAFGIGRPLAPEEDDPDDPTVLVIATSGSTGPPKGSLLPRSALAASAAATAARLGPPGHWLLVLPGQHIAGLQVLLRSLATGSSPFVMDTGEPFTPARFTAAADRLPDGPRYVSVVPTQLQRLLQDGPASEVLAGFTAVLVGGAATPAPLLDRARRAGVQVVTSYGMSETCGGCVYDGVPLDGVQIDLDPDGRIQLRGPVVGRGYRLLPGHPAFPGTGTFRTDDLGQVTGGRLQVRGRVDDVLISGGIKIAPAVLEAAIARVPGVAEVVVVGIPDDEWGQLAVAVVVPQAAAPLDPTQRDSSIALAEIRQACAAAGIPREQHPRALVTLPELPLRGPGKPDRTAAARLAEALLRRPDPSALTEPGGDVASRPRLPG